MFLPGPWGLWSLAFVVWTGSIYRYCWALLSPSSRPRVREGGQVSLYAQERYQVARGCFGPIVFLTSLWTISSTRRISLLNSATIKDMRRQLKLRSRLAARDCARTLKSNHILAVMCVAGTVLCEAKRRKHGSLRSDTYRQGVQEQHGGSHKERRE